MFEDGFPEKRLTIVSAHMRSNRSVAAVIIGGTLFSGGRGGVARTFLGVLVLAVLFSVLSMAGLGEEWQIMLNGIMILAIVGVHSRIGLQ